MKKICVIGTGGSGKTTLSNNLSELLTIPVFHLDTLYYEPEWKEGDFEIFKQKQQEIVRQENWIIDGNFSETMPIRFEHADTIIFLDYPRWRNLYGAFSRLLKFYGKNRKDMAEGCVESFDWGFIKHIWNFPKRSRPEILNILKKYQNQSNILIFKNDRQTAQWLASLK